MLTCENISLHKGGRRLFSGLSFTVFAGSCLIVRGANGSGKTSLLRLLAGLEKPEEGAIIWDGERIEKSADFVNECQALWHKNAMKPYLTVEENLLFWAKLNDAEMAMPAAIHLWQLQEKLDVIYGNLSQGWQRRVALARLLVSPGKLWLMDEPMANLDKEGIDLMERLIQSRCDQGGLVVLTSHIELDLPKSIDINIENFVC